MTQTDYDKKDIENYENLQKDYKKLLSEYDNMKAGDPHDPLLGEKIKELVEKQEEIQKASDKLV